MKTLTIGARRSPLAVTQAEWVASELARVGHPCELVGIDTLGDVDRRRLTEIGGTGVFATAVREHLLAGHVDIAVHSLKDLPVEPAPGLVVAAIPEREDVRDVLVGLDVEQWRDGSVIGTGSPRRAVQVEALARSRGVRVSVQPIRGNVDRRLGQVADGEVDATLLAAAGLRRLGHLASGAESSGTITTALGRELPYRLLELDQMLPAAGQGALAVECRADAPAEVLAALAEIDHGPTRAAVTAERRFLAVLEAGCLAPVGAHAHSAGSDLTLRVVAGRNSQNSTDDLVRATLTGPVTEAPDLGARLAGRVLGQLERI